MLATVVQATDFGGAVSDNLSMDGCLEIVLESADMHGNGAIVTFADGKSAFYSAALLRSVFAMAEELQGTSEDAESDVTWKRWR